MAEFLILGSRAESQRVALDLAVNPAAALCWRTEPVVSFRSVNTESDAEVFGCQHSGGCFNQAIGLRLRQLHSIMPNAAYFEAALEHFGKEFLTGYGIIGQVMVPLILSFERHRVFNVIFGEHIQLWLSVMSFG